MHSHIPQAEQTIAPRRHQGHQDRFDEGTYSEKNLCVQVEFKNIHRTQTHHQHIARQDDPGDQY